MIRPEASRRITSGAVACLAALSIALPLSCQERAVSSRASPEAEALIAELELRESAEAVRDRDGWTPPRRIVVRGSSSFVRSLQSEAPGVELIAASTLEAAVEAAPGADAIIGFCSAEVLSAGDRVRWIQIFTAGVERCASVPAVREREILVTNAQRLYGPEIAEHVMAMLLAFSRGLYRYIPEQAHARWNRGAVPRDRMWELADKTMLIVGLGGIGTQVAWRASALGMRVIATRRSSRTGPEFVDYVGLASELDSLVAVADVVVNAAPLTPETTGMFDAEFFTRMKPTAYFINVGRGKSVVTVDLVSALASGELAGAGLDVTDPEPLPADHPLWDLPNVIITPHVAGTSVEAAERRAILVRENLRRYVAGEPMLSVVDIERGY